MGKLRTFRKNMDKEAAAKAVHDRRPRRKVGTVHVHQLGPVEKNWRGKLIQRCTTCGATFGNF